MSAKSEETVTATDKVTGDCAMMKVKRDL
jgi:hypothetical protein